MLIRGKGALLMFNKAGQGLQLFPPVIDLALRDFLLELVGVDVYFLASLCDPSPIRKRAVWRIHGMRCDVCGRTWGDGVGLARHHKIPQRLCLLLGLSKMQARNESNMAVLCEEHHDLADKRLRGAIAEKWPKLYCWKV